MKKSKHRRTTGTRKAWNMKTTITNGTNVTTTGDVVLAPGGVSAVMPGMGRIQCAAKDASNGLTGAISALCVNDGTDSVKVDGDAGGSVTIAAGASATITGPHDTKDAKLSLTFH